MHGGETKYICFMLLLYGHFYWKQSQQHSNHIFHCESSMCHWKQHQHSVGRKTKQADFKIVSLEWKILSPVESLDVVYTHCSGSHSQRRER